MFAYLSSRARTASSNSVNVHSKSPEFFFQVAHCVWEMIDGVLHLFDLFLQGCHLTTQGIEVLSRGGTAGDTVTLALAEICLQLVKTAGDVL
mmetsp:Transcript_64132/g.134841  ORF Transcript_64132/g.134841 Transcript_64132/m.134841 type:complete len:92 (-) Transcript_64132:1319-1594(-)